MKPKKPRVRGVSIWFNEEQLALLDKYMTRAYGNAAGDEHRKVIDKIVAARIKAADDRKKAARHVLRTHINEAR